MHEVKNALFERNVILKEVSLRLKLRISNLNLILSESKGKYEFVYGWLGSGGWYFCFKFLFDTKITNSFKMILLELKAMPDYPKAAGNVVYVGLKIASFILNNNISPSNVHCIGHSLG